MRFTQFAPRRAFTQRPGRENAQRFVEYATVTALVAQTTERALLLVSEKITPPVWVPRSKLDVSSRVKTIEAERGREITVQVELKFALDEGLV